MNYNNDCDKGKYMNTKMKIKNKGWALNKTVWDKTETLGILKREKATEPAKKN